MGKRLSPGSVLLVGALLLALSGSATAATVALITGKQIKNGSIELVDLSPAAKRALKGQRGPEGPPGAQGPAGPAGLAGAPGAPGGFDPAKVSYVTGPSTTIPSGAVASVHATCPQGTKVIGGGHFANINHVGGEQTFDGRTWTVIVLNDTLIDVDANAFAVCAAP